MVASLVMGTLLGFGALAVDLGMIQVAQRQLQASVDTAALAGAGYLDGSEEGLALARQWTVALAAENEVAKQAVQLASTDVALGVFHDDASPAFVPYDASVHEVDEVNAVRVTHVPPQLRAGLAGIAFGVTAFDLEASSTAVRRVRAGPARSSSCFLPFAVPECMLSQVGPGQNPPPLKFTFSPTPSDNIAWADIDNNPNTSELRKQLQGQCSNGIIEVGDWLYVNEGQHNDGLHELRDILNDSTARVPDTWPTELGAMPGRNGTTANKASDSEIRSANWGNVIQGPVAIVDAGGCGDPSFNKTVEITGITWAVVYDTNSKGKDKNVWMQLDFVTPHDLFGAVDNEASSPNVYGVSDPMLVSQ